MQSRRNYEIRSNATKIFLIMNYEDRICRSHQSDLTLKYYHEERKKLSSKLYLVYRP